MRYSARRHRSLGLLAASLALIGCELAAATVEVTPPSSPPLGTGDADTADGGDATAAANDGATAPDGEATIPVDGGSTSPPPTSRPITGNSSLANLAKSLAPGTWAQLNVANQNAHLGVGSISGTMIHYCNSMPWNPFNRSIEIVGADHNYFKMRNVRYSDDADQFALVADDIGLQPPGHGYDHVTVNPKTGDLYLRMYGGFTGTINIEKRPLGSSSFVAIPSLTGQTEQVAIGTAWWSGTFAGGGSQGALLVFNSGNATGNANDGHIALYDPVANDWFVNKSGMAPFYGSGSTYHSVIEYSAAKNVAVFGGGNAAPEKLWRLDANATSTPMPNVPTGKAVGIQRGLLVNEPTSGNFLLLSGGELWELDPSGAGTWTKQTGTRTPPANVGIPGPTTIDGMIATAIPEYGVVVFIKQTSQTGGTFFVYRHL